MTKSDRSVLLVFSFLLVLISIGCKEDSLQKVETPTIKYDLPIDAISNIETDGNQFLVPKAKLNYPVGFSFNADEGTEDQYLLEIEHVSLTYDTQEWPLLNDEWHVINNTLYAIPDQIPEKNGRWVISVEFIMQKKTNDEWVEVLDDNGEALVFSVSIRVAIIDSNTLGASSFEEEEELNVFRPNIFLDINFFPEKEAQTIESFEGITNEYNIELSKDDEQIDVDFEILEEEKLLKIVPSEVLCKSCKYTLTVSESYFYKFDDKKIALKSASGLVTNTKTITFLGSSEEIETSIIDPNNIDYAYPSDRQYHFLQKEYDFGYLKLLHEQEDLFISGSGSDWTMFAYISAIDGSHSYTESLSYNDLTFEYSIPQSLEHETIYKGEFIELSSNNEESVFHTFYFRTSLYDTFEEKIQNNRPVGGTWRDPVSSDIPRPYRIGNNLSFADEPFGLLEIGGSDEKHISPFLFLENDFENNSFYNNVYYDLIYKVVDEGLLSIEENTEYGIPPVNSIFWWQYPYNITLTDGQISSNLAPNVLDEGDIGGTVSNLAHVYFISHYNELRAKAGTYHDQTDSLIINLGAFNNFSTPYNFPYYIHYTLPGNKHTSTYHYLFE